MSVIIPYANTLIEGRGAFIKPNGEILLINNNHEEFAREYLSHIDLLSKEELYLYKKWLQNSNSMSDFLFFILAFDKVEESWRKVISTTDINPHSRFYNYYLMDWNIYQASKMIYDSDIDSFKFIGTRSSFFNYRDGEVEQEIDDIKRRTRKKDRNLFFK